MGKGPKGQEFPVEVYYVINHQGMNEVTFIGFKSVAEAKEKVPDLLENPNWVDVYGDQSRFESIAVYNWLRNVVK